MVPESLEGEGRRGPVFPTRILSSALPKQQKEMGCFCHSHLLSALLNGLSVLP